MVKSIGEAPKQYPVKPVFRPIPDDVPLSVVDELTDAAAEPAADDLVVFETLEAGAQRAPREADDDPLSLVTEVELGVDEDDLHDLGDDQTDEDGITDDDDQDDQQDDDEGFDDDEYSQGRGRGRRSSTYDSDDY
jgi:hypothetical protein